jgi:hypothetical protein
MPHLEGALLLPNYPNNYYFIKIIAPPKNTIPSHPSQHSDGNYDKRIPSPPFP